MRTKPTAKRRAFACLLTAGLSLATFGAMTAYGGDSGLNEIQTVDGITIYLGVVPAEMILGEYSQGSAERKMHNGVPRGRGAHHVMIALFNAKTGKRITDATVAVTVRQLGLSGPMKKLTVMTVAGATTYGNYFSMPSDVEYRIDVTARIPGHKEPVKAQFDYERITE